MKTLLALTSYRRRLIEAAVECMECTEEEVASYISYLQGEMKPELTRYEHVLTRTGLLCLEEAFKGVDERIIDNFIHPHRKSNSLPNMTIVFSASSVYYDVKSDAMGRYGYVAVDEEETCTLDFMRAAFLTADLLSTLSCPTHPPSFAPITIVGDRRCRTSR